MQFRILAAVLALGVWLAPAGAAQAQSSLETVGKSHGFTYVSDQLNVPAQDEDAAVVPCPGELRAISGGVELAGGPEASYIGMQSARFGDGWTTSAWDGTGNNSVAQIWAICTKFGGEDVEIPSNDRGVGEGPSTESIKASCDKGDLLGGGGFFAGGHFDTWYLNSSYPKGDGWTWTGYHLDGAAESELGVEAYCQIGKGKSDIQKKSVTTDEEHVKLKVSCKKGVASAGGGAASEDAVNAHLVKTVPIDSKDKKKVPDDGWAIEYENDGVIEQKFTAYVVCR